MTAVPLYGIPIGHYGIYPIALRANYVLRSFIPYAKGTNIARCRSSRVPLDFLAKAAGFWPHGPANFRPFIPQRQFGKRAHPPRDNSILASCDLTWLTEETTIRGMLCLLCLSSMPLTALDSEPNQLQESEINIMTKLLKITFLSPILLALVLRAAAQTPTSEQTGDASAQTASADPQETANQYGKSQQDLTPGQWKGRLIVGPLNLDCINKPCSAASVTATARGSGVNGPLTAQTGMTINMSKDKWWTGGKVGEVDGLGILVRQNGPHSDSSGILVNVQNQGHGFLSATEFASSIVDPVKNILTYGIDVQEGVLDHLNGDYIGAVYTADYGALATGIQIQNSSPSATWQYAIKYLKNGDAIFTLSMAWATSSVPAFFLEASNLNGGDTTNGSGMSETLPTTQPHLCVDLNGFGKQNNVRMINDANGQLTVNTATGGNLQVNANGIFTTESFHVNLATPASSSAPCVAGQIGADANYLYVCVATNRWKRSALSSF